MFTICGFKKETKKVEYCWNTYWIKITMSSRFPLTSLCEKTAAGVPQLLEDLQKLLEDQDSCDIVFILGRDEERVYAHKIILMAR